MQLGKWLDETSGAQARLVTSDPWEGGRRRHLSGDPSASS